MDSRHFFASVKRATSRLQLLIFLMASTAFALGCSSPTDDRGSFTFVMRDALDLIHDGVNVCEFSSPTRELYVSHPDENTKLFQWNISEKKLIHTYECPKQGSWWSDAVVSPQGQILVAYAYPANGSHAELYFIDTLNHKVIHTFDYEYNIRTIRFDRLGTHVWIEPTYPGPDNFVRDLDGNTIFQFDPNDFVPSWHDKLWDVPSSKVGPPSGLFFSRKGVPWLLVSNPLNQNYALSSNGEYIGTTTWDERLLIWRSSDCQKVFEANVGGHPVCLEYDAVENQLLIVNGHDGNTSLKSILLPQ